MLRFVHAFRGLAMALVVLSHGKLLVVWQTPLTPWQAGVRSLIEGADIPFWFIAGFLFQHRIANYRYRPYLWSRARHVALPYLVCSVPALAHAWVFRYGVFEAFDTASWEQLTWGLLHSLLTANHLFVPYWFIPTILVLYLVAPLLAAIDRYPRLYGLLPPALVAGALVHLSMFYLDVFRDAVSVLPVYLLGMAVSRNHAEVLPLLRRHRHSLLAAGLLLGAAGIAIEHPERLMSAHMLSTENGVLDYAYLQKTLLSLWAFERLAHWDSSVDLDASRLYRALARIADLSFGIFFVHMYLVLFVIAPALARLQLEIDAGLIPVLGLGGICVAGSYGVVIVVKRATGRYSRYVIGC